MDKDRFIFHDEWGRRWRKFKLLSAAGAVLVITGLALFTTSLFVAPKIEAPSSIASLKSLARAFDRAQQAPGAGQDDQALAALRAKGGASPPAASGRNHAADIRAAFFAASDENALGTVMEHRGVLTHVCPELFRFTDIEEGMVEDPEALTDELPGDASPRLMPVLSNLEGDRRIPEAVEALALAGEQEKREFAAKLAERLRELGASGIVIDWQEVEQGADHELGELVAFVADSLRAHALETWLCVGLDSTFAGWDFGRLAGHVDRFVALLHDEHGETDHAGPLASQDWCEGWLDVLGRGGHPAKWIASLGCHGVDWAQGAPAGERISFADAMSRAGNAGCQKVRNGPPFFNGTFSYFYGGVAHEVWFLDAATFANQSNAARARGLGGLAMNDAGLADAAIWKALGSDSALTPGMLDRNMPGGRAITSIGQGEVVNLDPTSFDGKRTFLAGAAGRIGCDYDKPPAHPTLFRMGGGDGGLVCLTFDDGPDPDWTPAILDILKARGLHAMFFIVGSEAERYPEIVERIAAEGHEIGNHSYTHANLAKAPEALIRLELNANQRLIESIVGRSTALFRPPYNADSRPSNINELPPIEVAQSLGYMTVLENIDPRDWQEPTPEELLQRVKEARAGGNILLLHDGGGDRSTTVEALPAILDYLQERGDRIVKISELVGIDENELMPPVQRADVSVNSVASGTGFTVIRTIGSLLHAFLVLAMVLVLLRTVLVVVLALRHKSRPPMATHSGRPLSVIIPAFNEEKVIAKTIRSMLAADYDGPVEVLVVDDGSSDGTAEVVEAIQDDRVRLIRQANAGKARALQNGVAQAAGGILVFADADTQFDREALGQLAAALEDGKVGAVSGQARVGNLRTFVGRCQDLEYVCNFNLDRRAYAAWNCITVVPGAISAIRREALEAAGGFSRDTLAEDTDLTLAIHRAGYRVEYAPGAIARTEAPETLGQLARQRFRWAFGTLQCVWKHRDLVFNPRFKALGWFSLPGIWFFQVILVAFSPLIDLLFLQSLLMGHAGDILPYFLGFLACDVLLAAIAVAIEGMPLRMALRIIPQRFIHRPLLSYVVWRSLFQAMRGAWVGWGKLPRTASVPAT